MPLRRSPRAPTIFASTDTRLASSPLFPRQRVNGALPLRQELQCRKALLRRRMAFLPPSLPFRLKRRIFQLRLPRQRAAAGFNRLQCRQWLSSRPPATFRQQQQANAAQWGFRSATLETSDPTSVQRNLERRGGGEGHQRPERLHVIGRRQTSSINRRSQQAQSSGRSP